MPEANRRIVMDTSPLLALCAACGDFSVLRTIYDSAIVPYEVAEAIRLAGHVIAPGPSVLGGED
ncbi:MAG: hypothetical protein KFB96_20170 [Thiocapsa sp.]|uniref:hypothetical protein n=1 Tax=Thiocapsa sp. TaxID=2024551 RepID=UPI001BD08DB0|nr:hypothetical protein [Thiocapsa sp.]QVL47948.1 MAG: hypothetical protein KFB96_20170 [Thiocapsa sp.]